MPQLIEVRVLGAFRVRAADGELIDPRAWRTAKTRDLLRLLAVAGKPVPAERVIDALWPGADPARGRGSLRTAASQVRQVLGGASLVRRGDALELSGVWVDADAFKARAAAARHRLAEGDAGGGLAAAWEAVALYGGDLCEDESYADWASDERDALRRLLRQLLLDAGESACAAGWWRDAVELGQQALDVDPCAERAYRVLMQAYAGLGETGQALGVFDVCRRTLAEELGADPDEKTLSLHLHLLRPQASQEPRSSLVAREPMLAQVRSSMAVVVEEGRPRVVTITGPAGIGRTRFLREAAGLWSERVVWLAPQAGDALHPGSLLGDLAAALGLGAEATRGAAEGLVAQLKGGPLLLVIDGAHEADAHSLAVLCRLLEEPAQPLLVLAAAPEELETAHPLGALTSVGMTLPALVREEVAQVLTELLGGPPSRNLVDELAASSRGRPGVLLDTVRGLLANGQLLSTTAGMVRVPQPGGVGRAPAPGPLLARARECVGPLGAGVLDLLAVLDRPTTLPELSRVGGADRADVQLALDHLCDLQVVVRRPTGYALADALLREAAYRWLRPSASRDLHRRVAELAYLPAAVRVEHWLRAGQPALACAAALEAADEALALGDDVQLRTQLRTVRAFAETHSTDVEEKVLLCERLAEVASRLGRRWEAQELLEQAEGLARTGAPGALPRLRRALGRHSASVDQALRQYAAAAVADVNADERRQTSCLVAAAVTAQEPRRAVEMLTETIAAADDAGDTTSQIEGRVLLARAAGQRRDLGTARRAAKEAMHLAEEIGDDALFARAALTLVQTPAFLGDGLRHLGLLQRIRDTKVSGGTAAAEALDLTWCLVLHDLGREDFEQSWRRISASPRSGGRGRLFALLEVHFSLERDQPRRAGRLLDQLPEVLGVDVADDAARILRARLLVLEGDLDGAERCLRSVLTDRPSGPSLFAAEAGARLSALLAAGDVDAARLHLDQARTLTAERAFPREQVLMLRASAEVLLGEGNPSGAATLALAAAMTARRSGLLQHEAEAHARHQTLRSAAGVRHLGAPKVAALRRQPLERRWA